MKYFLGIDPGKAGGLAVVSEDMSEAEAHRFPGDIANSAELLRDLADRYEIAMACVEKVSAMPEQGVSSTFNFGTNYGSHLGALAALGIPHILVTPRSWQKKMLDSGTGQTKERSLNMARRLFPDVDLKYKADNGKSDALHLARYARLKINGE